MIFLKVKYLEKQLSLIILFNIILLEAAVASNISSTDKYAWHTNSGWINFNTLHSGVTVYSDHLEGNAWAENIGWIRLGTYTGGGSYSYANTSQMNYGVNHDSSGRLSGYAWSKNVGWINFAPTHGGVTMDLATGDFEGYAWGERVGWIHFKNTSLIAYKVRYELAAVALVPPEPVSTINGNVSGTMNGHGEIIDEEITIAEMGSVSNVTFEADVENHGLVSNVTVGPNATLTGGTVSGTLTNEGTIKDIHFVGTELSGGTLMGEITNDSQVGGVIKDVHLAAGTTLKGGRLDGEITSDPDNPAFITAVDIQPGSQLSHVRLSPTAQIPDDVELGPGVYVPDPDNPTLEDFNLDPRDIVEWDEQTLVELEPEVFGVLMPEQIAQISPETFSAMTPEMMSHFSKAGLSGLTVDQFENIPLEALNGLTSENMSGFSLKVLKDFDSEQLSALDVKEFKTQTGPDVSKILTNLNLEISPTEVIDLLPPGWSVDEETGALTAPEGESVALPLLDQAEDVKSQLRFEPFDLKQGFGVSGRGEPVLDQMKESLKEADFEGVDFEEWELSQNEETGILTAKKNNASVRQNQLLQKLFSFFIHNGNMIQVDKKKISLKRILNRNKGNFFEIVDAGGVKYELMGSPHDLDKLKMVVGVPKDNEQAEEAIGGQITMYEHKEVLIQLPYKKCDSELHVVIFSPLVEPAGEKPPGLYLDCEDSSNEVVYQDGTLQQIYPTFLEPDIFSETAQDEANNINKVTRRSDGTFKVQLPRGSKIVEPEPQLEIIPIDPDEKLPSIKLEGNKVIYLLPMDDIQSQRRGSGSAGQSTGSF